MRNAEAEDRLRVSSTVAEAVATQLMEANNQRTATEEEEEVEEGSTGAVWEVE